MILSMAYLIKVFTYFLGDLEFFHYSKFIVHPNATFHKVQFSPFQIRKVKVVYFKLCRIRKLIFLKGEK